VCKTTFGERSCRKSGPVHPGELNTSSSTRQGLLVAMWGLGTVHGVQMHTPSSANLLAERGSFVPGCNELVCEAAIKVVSSDGLTLAGVGSRRQSWPRAAVLDGLQRASTLRQPACPRRKPK